MVCAGNYAGRPERVGALLRFHWSLPSAIGVDSAERRVVRHAGHHDVAFQHLWKARVRVTVTLLRPFLRR